MNPVQTLPSNFFDTHFNIIVHFCFGFPDPGWICIYPEVGEGSGKTYTGGFVRKI
jgi:hypothetical protein